MFWCLPRFVRFFEEFDRPFLHQLPLCGEICSRFGSFCNLGGNFGRGVLFWNRFVEGFCKVLRVVAACELSSAQIDSKG